MLTRIANGRVIDPANGRDDVGDIWIRDGRIADPPSGRRADETHDVKSKIVMAGGIDVHSHIAGSNVNAARLMLPEVYGATLRPADDLPSFKAGWSAPETGFLYARMGFTTVVEPAVSPDYALHAHLELADIPIIDKAALSILGNDDFLLSLLRANEGEEVIRDYVAWTLQRSRSLGIKVVNAGGAMAFKANVRTFSFDDIVPHYGVSSRQIVKALQTAVNGLGVPHPLHVHCNNLGVPAGSDTALATIDAAEGLPLHLAHLQFYSYGSEGDRGFSSAAPRLAEAVNKARNVTIDVGQVMFGQTVTISSDVLRQFNARNWAVPKKWVIFDTDGNGGGVLPYNYRPTDYHNAVQWAVGLELFLLIEDPWRVFATTDHPNGGHFTNYPEIFALLMDRERRAQWIEKLPEEARRVTTLASIQREYTLGELATMTRAAPARLLGLADRGHLGAGSVADVAIYNDDADRERMFRSAALVLKDGRVVVRDGEVVDWTYGRALTVRPDHDAAIDRRMRKYFDERYGVPAGAVEVPESAIGRPDPFELVPCAR